MASRTATIAGVNLLREDNSNMSVDVAGSRVRLAEVLLRNDTADTVIGGTDTLDVTLAAIQSALQNTRRDGRVATVRAASVSGAAVVGNAAYAATMTFGSTISLTPRSPNDWTTNATLPNNATATLRPYALVVAYTLS
jgi:hypothetical protein